MKLEEVNIRDPFVLLDEGTYYLYGTRSASCWGPMDGFDCYVSADLEEWEGPIEIFHRPEGFFATQNYWAPECVKRDGAYYLVTTLASEERKKGIYVLKAEKPTGPFEVYSDLITPEGWTSIDGTVHADAKGMPWLIFSHSFEDTPDGDMCAMPLTKDLRAAAGEPMLLFSANAAAWAKPVPFAKAEFGMDGDVYFTDGPFVTDVDGALYMTWSSWSTCGYAVGVAVSESGLVQGPWKQQEKPLFSENGGHGMMLKEADGTLRFVLHYPNDKYQEHPVFTTVEVRDGEMVVVE